MSRRLLGLLQLCDPALPIGTFSHSSGLETYVQKQLVTDFSTSADYVSGMLRYGLFYTDAAIASLAFDAASSGDLTRINALDEEITAVKLPLETRTASSKLGIRLLKLFEGLMPKPLLEAYGAAIKCGNANGNYAVVFGILSFMLDIEKKEALAGFYFNAAAGMVTNCVKLVPLGQQDGQRLLFSLHPLIEQLVEGTLVPDEALIGFSCPGFDIRCMQHESLYSRLYMS